MHYFCSILICITRLYVKMNILFFFSIIYNDHLSLTFIEARKLNLHIYKSFFPYIFICIYMCVCVTYRPQVSTLNSILHSVYLGEPI